MAALRAVMQGPSRGVFTISRRGEGFDVVAFTGAAAARTRLQDLTPSALPLGAALGAGLSAEAVSSSFPSIDSLQKLRRSFVPTNRFLNATQERFFG